MFRPTGIYQYADTFALWTNLLTGLNTPYGELNVLQRAQINYITFQTCE